MHLCNTRQDKWQRCVAGWARYQQMQRLEAENCQQAELFVQPASGHLSDTAVVHGHCCSRALIASHAALCMKALNVVLPQVAASTFSTTQMMMRSPEDGEKNGHNEVLSQMSPQTMAVCQHCSGKGGECYLQHSLHVLPDTPLSIPHLVCIAKPAPL